MYFVRTAMLPFIGIAVTARRDFPHFDVNPNSGEPESKADHPRIAENRIFVDLQRPSDIVLPIIPSAAGAGEVRCALRWGGRIDTLAGSNLRGGRCGAE